MNSHFLAFCPFFYFLIADSLVPSFFHFGAFFPCCFIFKLAHFPFPELSRFLRLALPRVFFYLFSLPSLHSPTRRFLVPLEWLKSEALCLFVCCVFVSFLLFLVLISSVPSAFPCLVFVSVIYSFFSYCLSPPSFVCFTLVSPRSLFSSVNGVRFLSLDTFSLLFTLFVFLFLPTSFCFAAYHSYCFVPPLLLRSLLILLILFVFFFLRTYTLSSSHSLFPFSLYSLFGFFSFFLFYLSSSFSLLILFALFLLLTLFVFLLLLLLVILFFLFIV